MGLRPRFSARPRLEPHAPLAASFLQCLSAELLVRNALEHTPARSAATSPSRTTPRSPFAAASRT
eukprot:13252812-Alexandrium_andersonii.AAC.1